MNGKNGLDIGPDLAGIRNRSKKAILRDIIQPNQAIADGFELWVINTSENRYIGIIDNESIGLITLKEITGQTYQIERSRIESMEAARTSAMPEGLVSGLTRQELADLLAYIKGE